MPIPCPYAGETELVEALQKGDIHAHYRLVELYGGRIKGWIRYFAKLHLSEEDIEELNYRTFEKIIRGIASFDRKKGRLTTWMYKVAQNTLKDHERKLKTKQEAFETGFEHIEDLKELTKRDPAFRDPRTEPESDPHDIPERPNASLLRQALESLSGEHQTILREWAYLQSHAKLARLLNRRQGTVRVQFHRAMKALKAEYERLQAQTKPS